MRRNYKNRNCNKIPNYRYNKKIIINEKSINNTKIATKRKLEKK